MFESVLENNIAGSLSYGTALICILTSVSMKTSFDVTVVCWMGFLTKSVSQITLPWTTV